MKSMNNPKDTKRSSSFHINQNNSTNHSLANASHALPRRALAGNTLGSGIIRRKYSRIAENFAALEVQRLVSKPQCPLVMSKLRELSLMSPDEIDCFNGYCKREKYSDEMSLILKYHQFDIVQPYFYKMKGVGEAMDWNLQKKKSLLKKAIEDALQNLTQEQIAACYVNLEEYMHKTVRFIDNPKEHFEDPVLFLPSTYTIYKAVFPVDRIQVCPMVVSCEQEQTYCLRIDSVDERLSIVSYCSASPNESSDSLWQVCQQIEKEQTESHLLFSPTPKAAEVGIVQGYIIQKKVQSLVNSQNKVKFTFRPETLKYEAETPVAKNGSLNRAKRRCIDEKLVRIVGNKFRQSSKRSTNTIKISDVHESKVARIKKTPSFVLSFAETAENNNRSNVRLTNEERSRSLKKGPVSQKAHQDGRFNLKPTIDLDSLSLCRKPKSLVKRGNSRLAILRSNVNTGVENFGYEVNRACLTRQTTAEVCSPSRIRHQDNSLGDLMRDLKPVVYPSKQSLQMHHDIYDRNIAVISPIRSFHPSFVQSSPNSKPQIAVDWKKNLMTKLMNRISQESKVSSPYKTARRPDVSGPKQPVISVFKTSNKNIHEPSAFAGRVSLHTPHN